MIPNPKPHGGMTSSYKPLPSYPPLVRKPIKMVINYVESSKMGIFFCIHLALHSEMLRMFFPDSFCLSPLTSNASLCISNIVTVKSSQCYLQHKFENKTANLGLKQKLEQNISPKQLLEEFLLRLFNVFCTTKCFHQGVHNKTTPNLPKQQQQQQQKKKQQQQTQTIVKKKGEKTYHHHMLSPSDTLGLRFGQIVLANFDKKELPSNGGGGVT